MLNRKHNRIKWDQRFLGICNELSTWSSCLSRQIGAVLVRDKTIIATGYNGPPRGVPHCGKERNVEDSNLFLILQSARQAEGLLGDDTMCPRYRLGLKSGDGLNLCPAAHAEANCINNAARIGVRTSGSTMYMNCPVPCKDCLKAIINAGIKEIVCTAWTKYDALSEYLIKNSELKIKIYESIDGGTISQE